MEDLKKILGPLKEHSVEPPTGLFDAIYDQIKNTPDITYTEKELALTELKDASVTPPPFLLDNILSKIKEDNKKETPAKVIRFNSKRIMAIAAGVLILFSAWGIYKRLNQPGAEINKNKNLATTTPNINTDTTALQTNNDIVLNVPATDASVTSGKVMSGRNKRSPGFVSTINKTTVSVDGYAFTVEDNDFMATFTSFNYAKLPPFLTNNNTEPLVLNVDKSSSISISKGMLAMLQKSYATKKNGKPTNKAKREKRKLERWRKADATFFDKYVEKNPLDPADLAEFVF